MASTLKRLTVSFLKATGIACHALISRHLYCRHGFAARYLIEQGADPFLQDRAQHRSAIHYAAAKGKAESLRRLLDDNLRIHTEQGFVALKDARVQDVSGNCR